MRARILATIALLAVGCSTLAPANSLRPALTGPRTANAATNLYPIAEGTRWDYRLTQYKDGVPTGRIDTMTNQVVLARLVADGAQAKIERRYGAMAVPATEALITAQRVRLARWQEAPPSTVQATPTGTSQGLLPLEGGGGVGVIMPTPPARRQLSTFAGSPPPSLPPQGGGIRGLLAFGAPQRLSNGASTLTDQELTTSIDVLHFPLVPGESWTGRVWTFAKETLTARGWEPLTVPAGTFNAWHVSHQIVYQDGRTDNLGYWYAPNVGMIKAHEETAMPMNGALVRFAVDGELISQVNPQANGLPQTR